MEAIIWFALLVTFAVVEIATINLVSIWFVFGSLAALVCALFDGPFLLQFFLFVAVSGIALVLTRPLVKKFLATPKKPTNADRIFSMTGVVTEEIDNTSATGAVRIGGKVWTARSQTGEILKVGTYVRPQRIDGVKLIVVKSDED